MLKTFQVTIEVEEDDDNDEAMSWLKNEVGKDMIKEAVTNGLDFECGVRVTETTKP